MDQSVDGVLQGPDKLQYIQNARLAKDGRLEVRPSFTQLSFDSMSANPVTLYDLVSYAGRLTALGDQTGSSRATDVFEYVPSISKWRGTAGSSIQARLPSFTDVRQIGLLPDRAQAVRNVSMAATTNALCIVVNHRTRSSLPLGEPGAVVLIINPTTNQTILYKFISDLRGARVVYAGSNFWIFGVDSGDDVVSYNFNPASDETLTGPTNRVALAGNWYDLAMGPFGTGFAIAYGINAVATTVFTYNSSGVQQATWVASANDSDALALVGNSAGTLLSVVRKDDAADTVSISTFNAAGVLQSGPTNLFSGVVTNSQLGCCLVGSDVYVTTSVVNSGTVQDVLEQRVTQSTHALTTVTTYYNATLHDAPFTVGTRAFFGAGPASADTTNAFHVVEEPNLPQTFIQGATPVVLSENAVHQACVLGTKVYFAVSSFAEDTGNVGDSRRYAVYEAETSGTSRRQMVPVGGELLISGGVPLTYDGRVLAEQGFAEQPTIRGVQDPGGSLTLLGIYTAVATWECFDGKGRLLRSQASEPFTVTLTGANQSIVWTVSTPHSLRRHPAYADQNLSLRVRVYRTEAGEGVFFLDNETVVSASALPAQSVTIESSQSDTNLIDNLILYEQSQAAISNLAPPPYRYIWPARERAFVGGLPEEEAWSFSKLLFPAEPVEWASSGRLGFSGRVGQPITAVAAFETAGLVWTTQEIWQIPGRGPEHNGTGEFDPSTPIATPGGASDWRSIIVTPAGAFFQMADDRLMLLDRSGQVSRVGDPVQDTLASYPDITGCVFVRTQDIVAFACNNSAGTDGVLLVFDMRNQQWFVDTIGSPISAISELDGRLVLLQTGIAYWQNATIGLGTGALPTMIFETPSYRFFGGGGWGDLYKVALVGTYLGDCTVGLEISYDDGKTWETSVSFAVTSAAMVNAQTGAALSSGDPITLVWEPAKMETDRFRLRFTTSNATATGACRWHFISLEVEGNEHITRQAATRQR